MFSFHVVLAALAFAILVESRVVVFPSPLRTGSNEDQYRRGWGAAAAEAGGGEEAKVETARFDDKDATDRGLTTTDVQKKDGRRNSVHNSPSAQVPNTQQELSKEDIDHSRNRRSYYPYSIYNNYQVPQFQSISAWSPSVYPIQRPYYVPIYGVSGRIPLYFPQPPVYLNPGTPPKNPLKPPYVGPTYLPPVNPTYLPPVTPTPAENNTTKMPTDNRFGGDDDDDRPIWDNGGEGFQPARTPATQPSIVPTRKPAPSGPKTFPPLVHKDNQNINHLSADGNEGKPPSTVAPSRKQPPGPSRCVWAIVSCCSTSSKEVSYNCFDQLGCSGPFWDVSPCETEYAKAAIESALNYYNTRP